MIQIHLISLTAALLTPLGIAPEFRATPKYARPRAPKTLSKEGLQIDANGEEPESRQ